MNENIFSNFYNRVLSFFQKDKAQDGESAKESATNRLKLVLMQDRSNLDGAAMQKMREQLIAVISKYIEIDQEALDLNLESDGDEIALMLNIPVIRARTREEIDEIEAKEQEALNAKKDVSEDESSDEETSDEEISEESEEASEEDVAEDENSDDNEEENENAEDVVDSTEEENVEETEEKKKNKKK